MIPEFIILHHSLTKDGIAVDWQAIRKYHKSMGWLDIGYHFGIEQFGAGYETLIGRLWNEMGAHTKEQNMNSKSIGICVVGNYDLTDLPDPAYQLLLDLVRAVRDTWHIPLSNVKRHSDYATYKSCPGLKFPYQRLLDEL